MISREPSAPRVAALPPSILAIFWLDKAREMATVPGSLDITFKGDAQIDAGAKLPDLWRWAFSDDQAGSGIYSFQVRSPRWESWLQEI